MSGTDVQRPGGMDVTASERAPLWAIGLGVLLIAFRRIRLISDRCARPQTVDCGLALYNPGRGSGGRRAEGRIMRA